MHLEEVPKYRDTIVESICKCDKIIDLIRPSELPDMTASEMVDKYIFPYDRIINKTSEVGVYICFDIVVPIVINRAFDDFRIVVRVIAHDRRMRTPKGLVTDLICAEIDRLINGSNGFGVGRVEFKTWDSFNPAEGFYGRTLTYRTVDFNRE